MGVTGLGWLNGRVKKFTSEGLAEFKTAAAARGVGAQALGVLGVAAVMLRVMASIGLIGLVVRPRHVQRVGLEVNGDASVAF